jgi:hypothetical protein
VEDKIEAIDFFKHNSAEKTIEQFDCSKSNLYRWKRIEDKLRNTNTSRKRLKGGGSHIKSIAIEDEAVKFFESNRKSNFSVSGAELQLHLRNFAQDNKIDHSVSNGWLQRHYDRNNLVLRSETTKLSQVMPLDEKSSQEFFLKLYKMTLTYYKIRSPSQIINMDETSVAYDMPRGKTLEKKGTKDVTIRTLGQEKNCITAVLTVSASGEKLPPFVIIEGQNKEHKVPSHIGIPNGMIVKAQKNAFNSIILMKLWIETVLKPWLNLKGNVKTLLILDQVSLHLNEDIRFELSVLNVETLYIPAGCTPFLQPLDITVNRSFKAKLRANWDTWMKEEVHIKTKSGKCFIKHYLF